jgi:hypothetical protein
MNPSGRVATVTITGTGGVTQVSGSELRSLLGLRSTWFQIDVMGDLTATARQIVYGSKVTLSGSAPGLATVTLEQRPEGSRWSALEEVPVDANGSFSVALALKRTTSFRVRLPSSRSAPVRVAVAPLVTLGKTGPPTVLKGAIRPKSPGTRVRIERLGQSGWEAVGTAVVGNGGHFVARLDPPPGIYRARVAAAGGLVEGVSSRLTIGAG